MEVPVLRKRYSFVLSIIFTLALLLQPPLFSAPASADVYYAVSNYATGSIGTIRGGGGSFTVNKNLVNNLGRDAFGYSFLDPDGDPVALLREYEYGPDDHIMLYDPYKGNNDWAPFFETRGWVSNIHGVCSSGSYLYINTYESYASSGSNVQLPGELVRIDMNNGAYTLDRSIRMEEFQKDGSCWHYHGEGVMAVGDYIYALWSVSSHPMPSAYRPSELWKMTKDLQVVGRAYVGKNVGNLQSGNMAFHNGKMYIAAIGGWQGPGTWGDIYEVDVDTMESKKVLGGHDIVIYKDAAQTQRAAVGMYGITFAPDGTAFLLGGSYDGSFEAGYSGFFAKIFKTTAARLSKGDYGEEIGSFGAAGFSWTLVYDKFSNVLWAMTGKKLNRYDKSGKLQRVYEPNELGDNIYSISVIGEGGRKDWKDAETSEDIVPLPSGGMSGTMEEILSAKAFSPALTAQDVAAIKASLSNGGAPTELKNASGCTVSASRSGASPLFGTSADAVVSSLRVKGAIGNSNAVVFRPAFTLNDRAATLGGSAVTPPRSAAEFEKSMRLQLALANGTSFDISEKDYPGVLSVDISGSSSVVTLNAKIVLADGPVPGGDNADVKLKDGYLFVYDGVADGNVELATAVISTVPDAPAPTPPAPAPESGGGGGCDAAGSMPAAIFAAAASLILLKQKRRS